MTFFHTCKNILPRERLQNIVAPKEQPPRNLSGKKDRNILTLERDLILAEGAKLSGKYTDGYKELIWKQKKHRCINYIKIAMQNL